MAEPFRIFLSYNRRDIADVERLARALAGRGVTPFKDDWYLSPGEHWPSSLDRHLAHCGAVAVVIGANGLGPWQQREVYAAIDREVRERGEGREGFRVIPVLLSEGALAHAGLGFLSQNVWIEAWDPRAPDLLAGALEGKPPAELYDEVRPDPRTLVCPYRGLRVFREEDQAFYFGREEDLEKLTGAVGKHPVVAIVGASGSGKSSLARAGLVPRLRRHTGSRVWQVAIVDHPGQDPFFALAQALLPLWEPQRVLEWSKNQAYSEAKTLAASLRDDGASRLRLAVKDILDQEPGTTDLLVIVDQWEELYTYRPEGAAAFIDMLLDAVRERGVQVVLTLRADYWGDVLTHHPPLAARLAGEATVHLPALLRGGLEAVIRKPAERTSLVVDPVLVEALLNDAEDQPGDLPLLEFALRQLWEAQTGRRGALIMHAYEEMGRLARSIVTHAEAAYARLTPEEQEAVPGVFAALVHVEEARTDLRRRAYLRELSETGQAVARRLADERLLVTSREPGGDELVEVAHEALLRHWPKLEDWLQRRGDALRVVRQVQAETRVWLERQKNASHQWSHERVREAVAALRQIGTEVVLSKEEREFLGPIDPEEMLSELERPETSHKRRLLIGERLDVLGDPRDGVGVDEHGTPVIDWCDVPAGDVTISILSEPNNPYSEVAEAPRKRVEPFRIGRYPITAAQYRAFIAANDRGCDPATWSDELVRTLYHEAGGLLRGAGLGHGFGRFGNQPAVCVSWFDAALFCLWLTRRLGYAVRLPDEWEWQQAATGGDDGKVFPWGSGWDVEREPWRANTFESRLGQATAVGMYPAGASFPGGALDMAGSVWEWCLNKFETASYPYGDCHTRALRGGSWDFSLGFARTTCRDSLEPLDRSLNIGFRVMSNRL